MAQDQLKTQNSKEVIEGRIFEIETYNLKIRLPNSIEKRINFEAIDSIYTSSDSLRKKLRFTRGTRDKLSKSRLVSLNQELRAVSKFDTISSDPKDLAKSLAMAQVNILRIRETNKNAGASLYNAGALLMAGSITTVIGSLIAVSGKSPIGGAVFSLTGVVMVFGGYSKLIKSGNQLSRTSGNDLRVGIGNEGLAIQLRF